MKVFCHVVFLKEEKVNDEYRKVKKTRLKYVVCFFIQLFEANQIGVTFLPILNFDMVNAHSLHKHLLRPESYSGNDLAYNRNNFNRASNHQSTCF